MWKSAGVTKIEVKKDKSAQCHERMRGQACNWIKYFESSVVKDKNIVKLTWGVSEIFLLVLVTCDAHLLLERRDVVVFRLAAITVTTWSVVKTQARVIRIRARLRLWLYGQLPRHLLLTLHVELHVTLHVALHTVHVITLYKARLN